MNNIKSTNPITQPSDLPSEDDDPGSISQSRKKNNTRDSIKNFITRLLHLKNSAPIQEEVAGLIEEHDPEGIQVGSEERNILHNVLDLNKSKVSDVMVPRTDIIAVENTISLENLTQIIVKNEHTRTPVYKESLDNVIGFIHLKDLISILGNNKSFNINNYIRKILYVPPSMKVIDLLVKMRSNRVHMALVLDEYGGTDGLVTMEDLVEEIVGEIEDEHDDIEQNEINVIDDNTIEVSARIPVTNLEEHLNVSFGTKAENEDYDTAGGMIFFMLGRVPDVGEIVTHPTGYTFKVLDANPRSIKKLKISKI